jgi:hypothetical protein
MGKVVAWATVSLDGYIAGPSESGLEHLFADPASTRGC